jgi:hypothetical protein
VRGDYFFQNILKEDMKTYIVKEKDELKIIQVKPELEEAFQAQYGGMVLFSGDSIQDVLIQFGQSPVIIEPPQ